MKFDSEGDREWVPSVAMEIECEGEVIITTMLKVGS